MVNSPIDDIYKNKPSLTYTSSADSFETLDPDSTEYQRNNKNPKKDRKNKGSSPRNSLSNNNNFLFNKLFFNKNKRSDKSQRKNRILEFFSKLRARFINICSRKPPNDLDSSSEDLLEDINTIQNAPLLLHDYGTIAPVDKSGSTSVNNTATKQHSDIWTKESRYIRERNSMNSTRRTSRTGRRSPIMPKPRNNSPNNHSISDYDGFPQRARKI